MNSEMDPPIAQSIRHDEDKRNVKIGARVLRRDETTYILEDPDQTFLYQWDQSKIREGQEAQLHQAGTGSLVWRFGEAVIKVKGWREEMQLESDTIQHV